MDLDDAVPFEDVLVGIGDHAGLQRDDRIGDLEGRGRQLRLAGAVLVAGDDEIIVDLVADEGADRADIEKMLGEALANFAALGCDVGKASRRQQRRGGKKTERVAAMDHGSIRCGKDEGGDDADDIVVKR